MTCGLKELLLNGQSQEPAVAMFPRLFSCLTVRLGASVGVVAPRDNNNYSKNARNQFHVAGWVWSPERDHAVLMWRWSKPVLVPQSVSLVS